MVYPLPQDGYDTSTLAAIGSSDTTIYVAALPTVTSGVLTIYEQDGRTIREKVYFTATGGAGTATSPYYLTVTRGIRLIPSSNQILFTSDSTLQKSHGATRRIALTDSIHYAGLAMAILNGYQEAGGVIKNPASRTISDSRHLTDKEYVDAAAAAAGGITAFYVTQNGADPSLTINVGAGYFLSQGTVVAYAGGSAVAVTASQTNYVMLSRAGVLTVNITGFLAGYIPLAEVVCNGTDITGITDRRAWLTMGEGNNAGVTTDLTYGDTIAVGNLLYFDTATSKLKLAVSGVKAQGTGTFTGLPVNNETIVVGATTYTWKDTLTGAANEVKISTTAALSYANLIYAINDSGGVEGTDYGTGTVANASVTGAVGATTITLTAILPGTAGNSIATTEATSNFTFDAVTLGTTTAGVDGGERSDNAFFMALEAGVDTNTGKRVALPGSYVTGLSGLTVGDQYVSNTAGALSSSVPAAYRRRVGFAPTTTSFFLLPGILPTALSGLNTAASVANFNELLTLISTTDVTGAELETLSAGATSDADTLHTHKGLITSFMFEGIVNSASASGIVRSSGYSDATEDQIAVAVQQSTTDIAYLLNFKVSADVGAAPYLNNKPTSGSLGGASAASTTDPLTIGSDVWVSESTVGAIIKNGAAVTISGTNRFGPLGHNNTDAQLLVLYSTTKIAKFTGIAGTTITNAVDDVTLDTAVSQIGFAFDDTNNQYVCVDLTANILRKFNSSGVTIETVAYTIDDGSGTVVGVCLIKDRYYLVKTVAQSLTGINPTALTVSFIPTNMKR